MVTYWEIFLEPLAGIYVHWFEKNFVYNKDKSLRYCLKIWKRQVDDVFFVWKGTKNVLELFVRLLNGMEMKTQFKM